MTLETLDEQTTDEFITAEAKKLGPKVDQERLNLKEQLFYNEDLQSNRFIFDLKSKNIFQVKLSLLRLYQGTKIEI